MTRSISSSVALYSRVKNTFLDFGYGSNDEADLQAGGARQRSLSCPPLNCKALTSPTTMMLRKVPKTCTVDTLTAVLNERGFSGLYDFIYVPLDFKTRQSTGFAFINFCSNEVAQSFTGKFHLTKLANRTIKVCPARVQGLSANVEHFKNNPVNFATEHFRPKLFELGTGRLLPFPKPDCVQQTPSSPTSSSTMTTSVSLSGGSSISGDSEHRLRRGNEHHRGSNGDWPSYHGNNTHHLRDSILFIGGLHARTTAKSILEVIPNAIDVHVPLHTETGFSRGFAYVKLASPHDVNKFLTSDNIIIDGKAVGFRPFRGRDYKNSPSLLRSQPVSALSYAV
ncbi:hypothetical protein FOL47_003320 [Perkinsus chesapeaki]|uniref:RRM domain-containing protein n=1 Tax=Perkinsus chesapeaki TaxID=330153 RepID=A0A7J6MZS9_PERCH|nr:hypothetical protein FOL47_003320 [Perkinsus chesapeaki]